MHTSLKVWVAGFALLFSAVSAMALSFTPPPEGYYVGTVKITRSLASEGLSSTYTLKTQATVAANGTITMLTAAPELPADGVNVMKGINVAEPRREDYVGIPWNIVQIGSRGNQYVVDDWFAGFLKLGRSSFTLTYSSPSPNVRFYLGPVIAVQVNPTPPPIVTPLPVPPIEPTVTVEFSFRSAPKPAAVR